MKTEIKTGSGRVLLIYRGKDYGSYPHSILSFEKTGASGLLIRILESVLLPDSMANTLVNGEQLTPENFKELLYDGLQGGTGGPSTDRRLTVSPMSRVGWTYEGMERFYALFTVEGENLRQDITINVTNPDGLSPVGWRKVTRSWDNRTGGEMEVWAEGEAISVSAHIDVVSIDPDTASITIEVRNTGW